MIERFSLNEDHLQEGIIFIHRGREYPATVRLVRMNRSKPNKLAKSTLTKRQVIQFQWKNNLETKTMFRRNLPNVFEAIMLGEKNTRFSVLFQPENGSRFVLKFRQDQQEMHI